jgi:hypothetical protein
MGSSTMESLNGADTCEMCCWNGVPNASFDFAGCTLAVSMVGGAGSVAAGASAFAGCMLVEVSMAGGAGSAGAGASEADRSEDKDRLALPIRLLPRLLPPRLLPLRPAGRKYLSPDLMKCSAFNSSMPNAFHSSGSNLILLFSASASISLLSSLPLAGFSLPKSYHFRPVARLPSDALSSALRCLVMALNSLTQSQRRVAACRTTTGSRPVESGAQRE